MDPLLAKAVISNIFNNNTEIYGLVVMQNGNSGEVIPLVPYEDKSTNDKCGDSTVPIISKKGICPMSGSTYNYSNISLEQNTQFRIVKDRKTILTFDNNSSKYLNYLKFPLYKLVQSNTGAYNLNRFDAGEELSMNALCLANSVQKTENGNYALLPGGPYVYDATTKRALIQ